MTDLDPFANRANEPGWTKEARKAEQKAARKAFWGRIGAGLLAFFRAIPVIVFYSLAAAVAIAASAFDWFMSARGWNDLLPGIGIFAYVGAAACVGIWYFGLHQALENFRAKDRDEARNWVIVAVVAYVICVAGVGIATITNAGQAKQVARDSRLELAGLTQKRDALADKLDLYPVDFWKQALAADERSLKAQLAIAKGTHGLPNLDVEGPEAACAGKLNFNQQRACAYANGGIDPHTGAQVEGVRADIARDQNGLKAAEADQAEWEKLDKAVKTFDLKRGDDTAQALAGFFGGEAGGNWALLVVLSIISAGLLAAGGFFADWVWRKALPVKKGP